MQKKNSPANSSVTRELLDKATIEKRKKIIEKWRYLKSQDIPDEEIEKIVELSISQCYKIEKLYKTNGEQGLIKKSTRPHKVREKKPIPPELRQRVFELRMEFKTYGHFKIYHMIKNENPPYAFSERMVDNILKELIARGAVDVSIAYRPKRRRRNFTQTHAQAWKYEDTQHLKSGEMIQIDHMTENKVKIFRAVDPVTRFMVMKAYKEATSLCAVNFLHYVKKRLPFDVVSIQVDGGSEFMDQFENSCRINNIPLKVLPPKRPKYNGRVERANGIMRDEFYACYDIPSSLEAHNELIRRFEDHYNIRRPHSSLKGLTPLQYHKNTLEKHYAA
ncbi:MAG: integrase core domain-containing protein [Gammaproteobacteria bacterium]